ncbi:hypothetical protein [Ruegeria halocynthiae]|nr:hypothetical protein [Ruegeria halocynthiae]
MPAVFGHLKALARKNNAGLRYIATVCGGLPVLNLGDRGLVAGEIKEIRGVFNSTSNFILEQMSQGRSMAEALTTAQELGIAEADPSLVICGWDTAAKLCIIFNCLKNGSTTLADIDVTGIDILSPAIVQKARSDGEVVRLVASASDDALKVAPTVLKNSDFLATVTGWEKGVQLQTDIYGTISAKLWEREPIPTAASIIRDIVTLSAQV